MLAIGMKNKIVFVDSTTIIQFEGDATTILIDGEKYILHGKNVVGQILDAIRRGDNYVEVS